MAEATPSPRSPLAEWWTRYARFLLAPWAAFDDEQHEEDQERTAGSVGDRALAAAMGAAFLAIYWLFASLLLMGIGAAVVGLAKAAGAALPMAHDDPARVEVWGLVELDGYGLVVAAALTWALVLGRRLVPSRLRPSAAQMQGRVGRVAGATLLVVLAVGGVLTGIQDHDVGPFVMAAGFAYSATRVARGLSLDEDD